MENKFFPIATSVVLAALLLLLTDPFMLWMPAKVQMLVLLSAAVLACVWAGFIMYERSADERDIVHKMHAGRVAYLSGVAVLTIALIVQGFDHAIDPWITLALGTMVLAKLGARLYSEYTQ